VSNFWSDFFWKQVFPNLNLELALANYKPKNKGKYYLINCPGCSEPRAYCYKDTGAIKCNRDNQCGWKGDILNAYAVVQNATSGTSLTNENFVEVVSGLATLSGVRIPESALSPEQKIEAIRKKKFQNLHEEITERSKHLLLKSPQAVAYLNSRGFQPTQFYFGFIPNLEALELDESQLLETGFISRDGNQHSYKAWEQRIILPIRTKRDGCGFIGRLIDRPGNSAAGEPNHQRSRFLYTRGISLAEIGAVGLDLLKTERAIIVEGAMFGHLQVRTAEFDAIGIGGNLSAMTPGRWSKLYDAGIREITIASDADKAGQKYIIQALDARKAAFPAAPTVYVLDSGAYRDVKSPDDFILKYGRDEFRKIVKEREPDLSYRARVYAEGLDLTDKADLGRYTDRCLNFANTLQSPTEKLQRDLQFLPVVSEIAKANFESLRAFAQERDIEHRKSELAKDIVERATEQDFDGVRKALTEAYTSFLVGSKIRPVRVASEEIDDVNRVLAEYAGKRHIGITQKTLSRFDDALSGYRGVTILASGTSVGKTMFVIQNMLDILINNPDTCVVFASLEMEYHRIISRAWAHLGGINWDDMVMGSNRTYDSQNPFTPDDLARKAVGVRAFKRLAERLVVLDRTNTKNFTVDGIVYEDEKLRESTNCKRSLVVLDYVDVFDVPDDIARRATTEQEKWQMAQVIELRDRRNGDPVLGISEVRKGGGGVDADNSKLTINDVMGSARKIFAADAVAIYNNLTNIEYAERFDELSGGVSLRSEPIEIDTSKASERKKYNAAGERIRDIFARTGIAYSTISIPKVRDAGIRQVIPITNFFRRSTFREGFVNYDDLQPPKYPEHWQDDEDAVEF